MKLHRRKERPVVVLGQYKGLKVPVFRAEVTEEELDELINAARGELAVQYTVEYRPIEEGGPVTRVEIPEADDEFAQEVSDFPTLEAYRENLREQLLQEYEAKAQNDKEAAVLAAVLSDAEVTIPEDLIHQELERLLEDLEDELDDAESTMEEYCEELGITEEELSRNLSDQAKSQVTRQLLLEAIAETEGLEIAEEELEAEIEALSEEYDIDVEDLKDYYRGENLKLLERELKARAALELIVSSAVEE